jgi:DNA-binding beta-propeller fold protein YncE
VVPKQLAFTFNKFCAVMALLSTQLTFAANFNITPNGILPQMITAGQPVSANFTINNLTSTPRKGYFIRGLPAVVTQDATPPNCTNPINLEGYASCNLKLDITGPVSSSFAMCNSSNGPIHREDSCTTSAFPLKVAPSVAPTYFVANSGNNNILKCFADPNSGSLSCDIASGTLSFQDPRGIALNHNNTMAYITNFTSHTISPCSINSNLIIEECATPVHSGGSFPIGIALNASNTRIYVCNYASNTIYLCPINNKTLGPCINTDATDLPSGAGVEDIVLTKEGDGAYLVLREVSKVYYCPIIQPSGKFGNCHDTGANNLNTPNGIALNNAEDVIYVAPFLSPSLTQCPMDTTTHMVGGDCMLSSPSTSGLNAGIILNRAGDMAYVSNYYPGKTLYQCPITDGILGNCVASSTEGIINQPYYFAMTH